MIKQIKNKVSMLSTSYWRFRERLELFQLKMKSAEAVFTEIHRTNMWKGRDSRSGTGSDSEQTERIKQYLPALFNQYKISSVVDIPCGDYHWIKDVNMVGVDYVGADIVKELIHSNSDQFKKDGARFCQLNLLKDALPQVDLILCRDCLVHFSFEDCFLALQNACRSRSKYLLTTTFPATKINKDIITGQWRSINLEVAPFLFPEPIAMITEGCTEVGNKYADKSLALWRISDVQNCLSNR